jgi:hypothetical protein
MSSSTGNVSGASVWRTERNWRSEFPTRAELREEIRQLFAGFGHGCLAAETNIGVVHVCDAIYALRRCKDVADLTGVSRNLMHSSPTVTDSIYSELSSGQVGDRTDLTRQDCVRSQRPDTAGPAKGGRRWAHLDSNQGPTGSGRLSSSAMTGRDPDPGRLVTA